MSARRTTAAVILALAAGLAAADAATDGLQAFTLESARRLAALKSPRPVPDLAFDTSDGANRRLSEMPARVLLVDFVYTRCPTVCQTLGSVYARLQQRLAPEIAAGHVRLVSITFDPAHDSNAALHAYRARHTSDARGWEVGRPSRAEDLRAWLDAFGVVVIPDEFGGFAHNAAVHVVGPGRRLVAIHDLEDFDGIVAAARKALDRGGRHVAQR